jgi:hypothetical protein
MKVTLNEHLAMVDQNSQASRKEINSLCERMRKKFKDCGYKKICRDYKAKDLARRKQCEGLVREYVEMILKTQDYRCTHWLFVKGDELNGVWNRPGSKFCNWKIENIIYEIDHVLPVNAGGCDDLKNYQFLSSNANQFTKCSLTYEDLLRRVDLSVELKNRICTVLKRREELFKSAKWADYMSRVEKANESR